MVAVGVRTQLLFLERQGVVFLLQIAPTHLELRQRQNPVQLGVGQRLALLGKTDAGVAQGALPGLQLVREPPACLCPFQRLREAVGVRQHSTEILPDQRIQLLGGDEARRTATRPVGVGGGGLAGAQILGMPVVHRAGRAGQAADAATDQGAQQVGMGGVVASRTGLMVG